MAYARALTILAPMTAALVGLGLIIAGIAWLLDASNPFSVGLLLGGGIGIAAGAMAGATGQVPDSANPGPARSRLAQKPRS